MERTNNIRILSSVIKVDIVYESDAGELTAFFDSVGDSPLMHSEKLRGSLRAGAAGQKAPYLLKGEGGTYFAAIRAEGGCMLLGPMCSEKLSNVKRRQMLKTYGVEAEDIRTLPVFTLPEIRNMILLANTVLDNSDIENEELLRLNRIIFGNDFGQRVDQEKFLLKEEEQNEETESTYRHSYHEEQLLMQAIREGRTKDALRLAEGMDSDSGRLSGNYNRHLRNLSMIGIALCARAAIEGGISPEAAYRISGYYIDKCDVSQDPAHLLQYRNRAITDLADRVAEKLNRSGSSNYVEVAKDYIRKHYREKIYLADVAEELGLSEGYLSRLFRKESDESFQDYVNRERVARASNLLLYSDFSLSQIAEYVSFPNQSYFGKMFKKYKGMTPKAFRDRYRNREAFGISPK